MDADEQFGKIMTSKDFESLTHRIIGCAFEVGSELGIGYVEKVYENAMVHEMRKRGLKVAQQVRLEVFYDGVVVGDFFADVVVEGCVLLELKATKPSSTRIWPNHLITSKQPV